MISSVHILVCIRIFYWNIVDLLLQIILAFLIVVITIYNTNMLNLFALLDWLILFQILHLVGRLVFACINVFWVRHF